MDLIKWEIGKLIWKNKLRICIENIDNILKIWKIWIWYKRLFKIEVKYLYIEYINKILLNKEIFIYSVKSTIYIYLII